MLDATEFVVADGPTVTPVTVVITTTDSEASMYTTDSTTSAVSPNSSTASASSALGNSAVLPDVNTESKSSSATNNHRSTIIGVAIGVPLGLLGIVLLSFILRRHLKNKALHTATSVVYFPPDPIDPCATRIFPKIELDTTPNAIYELDGASAPSELEVSVSVSVGARRPLSAISELEGSPVTPPDPTSRASVATTLNEIRWSNVSSLAPPPAHQSSRAILSIVSQQHHGSGQDVFLTPPRPNASHRLSRPTSGLLPEIEVADDETHSTPKSSTITANKEGNSGIHESNESEQAVADRGTHGGKQDAISETARTSGERPHEREAADEDELSRKSGTKGQSGEVMHAGKITSEVEAAHECEDVQQSDANERAAEDMQPGEGQNENTTPHEADSQAQSSK